MQRTLRDFQNLTEEQRTALTALNGEPLFCENFYFTGGTLLKALGIVPRQSNDLDFFTFPTIRQREFPALLQSIRNVLQEAWGMGHLLATDRGFLHKPSGMLLDFMFDAIVPLDAGDRYDNIATAGLRDLGARKASALVSRDEVKDLIDIAFITEREKWLLKDLEKLAEDAFHLRTVSEEKLLAELIAKRDMFPIVATMFLCDGEQNKRRVERQIEHLIHHTSL